jgi:hypothetical protein
MTSKIEPLTQRELAQIRSRWAQFQKLSNGVETIEIIVRTDTEVQTLNAIIQSVNDVPVLLNEIYRLLGYDPDGNRVTDKSGGVLTELNQHLAACGHCRNHPLSLCANGNRLHDRVLAFLRAQDPASEPK